MHSEQVCTLTSSGGGVEGRGWGWKHEALRWLRWGMEKRGSNRRDILVEGAIMGYVENRVLDKYSKFHKDDPR